MCVCEEHCLLYKTPLRVADMPKYAQRAPATLMMPRCVPAPKGLIRKAQKNSQYAGSYMQPKCIPFDKVQHGARKNSQKC